MEPDRSWKALIDPGSAADFFLTEKPLQPFTVTSEYRPNNALILSELARLVYSDNVEQRRESLRRANLTLLRFYEKGGTQAMLVEGEGYAVLAFRGSSEPLDWYKTNFNFLPTHWSTGGKVPRGFAEAFLRAWPKIERHLERVKVPVYMTGHSMGGPLSLYAATLYKPMAVYTMDAARAGNTEFREALKDLAIYQIRHGDDVVPFLPMFYKNVRPLIEIGEQRRQKRPWPALEGMTFNREVDPPKFLSDHAPINISAALEELI